MTHPDGAPISGWLRAMIRCPRCHGELVDDAAAPQELALVCMRCQLGYPVRGGIPVLMTSAAAPRS